MLHITGLLCIFTFLSLSNSFNVDELCAKRCLYGRGGVLCNCNAMHFNGKRGGYSQAPANDPRGHNTEDYVPVPYDPLRTSLSEIKFTDHDSQNTHRVRPFMKTEYDIVSAVPVDMLNQLRGVQFLHNSGQDFDGMRAKEMTRYTNNAIKRNVKSLLPSSFSHEREEDNNSESNDEDFVDSRREMVSTIKQIMSMPTMASSHREGSVNFNDDFEYDANDRKDEEDDIDGGADSKHNIGNNNRAPAEEEDDWRQHLKHLQRLMRQVRHLR